MTTVAAAACIVASAQGAVHQLAAHPATAVNFIVLTIALQAFGVDVYGRHSKISVSGIGMLAVGFTLGSGVGMATAVLAAVTLAIRARSKFHRGLFNAAAFALATGSGSAVYQVLAGSGSASWERLFPAALGGVVFWLVNIGLLSLVLSLDEGTSMLSVWRERFRWLTPHYLAFGPIAFASTVAYERIGLAGLVAFVVPPALMILSTRQYLERTRESVEELRMANADLRILFEFAAGLAARAHDGGTLIRYVEQRLETLTGARIEILLGPLDRGIPLVAGGTQIASLEVAPGPRFDAERWDRLRDAILPQLATAIESAELVERVRKTHLDTIAALSRSMEAKDYYTGGHTERVSDVAVALAKRLGFDGADLDAVEIGALLHDIGKIGIPERILHKPGPLDDDEWKVMKEHPVISDYILSEVDLHPIVRAIARSSHERIDGAGYPDALAGDEIPLAARIVLVADAFDALTSDRPYRRGRDTPAALDELRANRGTQFCPDVLDALEELHLEEPQILGARRLRVA
jgi:putative nucleotidyltransferase with HDIG domain